MDIKVEISPKEITAKVETPNEPIYGGTKNYENLENLPLINGSVIIGDMTLSQLGIQPQGDYAERSELPVNVSELYNDAGYLVQSDLSDYAKTENIPTKVSELENDSDYATTMQIPTKTSQLSNDSEFAYTKDIPTNVSQLVNDSDYATKSDLPTKTSELLNDSNLAYVSDIPTKFSELENDSLKNVDNTSDENKPVSIAQRKAIDDAYANSNAYTDQKIADLIGGAPETLDTLKEVADAIAESKDVEEALNSAIGTKANQTELDTHTGNDTIHIVANERTTWNNKYDKPTNGIPKTDLESSVQTSLVKADTALQEHQDISGLATKVELSTHVNNTKNPHEVTAEQVGLGNCDNTSDSDKPISNAQQNAFDEINNNLGQLEYSDVAGGKNLIDFSKISIGYELNGEKLIVNAEWYVTDYIKVKPNTTYTISGTSSNYVCMYDSNKNYIISSRSQTFTTSNTTEYVRANSIISGYDNAMIEEGTTATPYEPYIPSVKTLAEKTTQIDDLNILGWLVPEEMPIKNYVDSNGVFHQRVNRVDLSVLDWKYDAGTKAFFSTSIKDTAKATSEFVMANIYNFKYETDKASVVYSSSHKDKTIGYGFSNGFIMVCDLSHTDVTSFKNANKGNYLYYELATEITTNVDGNEAVTKVNDSLVGIINSLPANIISGSGNVSGMSYSNGTITSNWTDTRAFCLRLFLGTSSNSQAVEIYGRDYFKKGKFKLKFKPTSNYTILRVKHNGETIDLYADLKVELVANKEYIITFNCVNNDISTSGGLVISDIVVCCADFGEEIPKYVPYTGTSGRLNEDVSKLKNDLDGLIAELKNKGVID